MGLDHTIFGEGRYVQGGPSLTGDLPGGGGGVGGLWQLILIKLCFVQIRQIQMRFLSASAVAQMLSLQSENHPGGFFQLLHLHSPTPCSQCMY